MKNVNIEGHKKSNLKMGLPVRPFINGVFERDSVAGTDFGKDVVTVEAPHPDDVPVEYLCLLYRF